MKVVVTEAAWDDLFAIGQAIKEDNRARALSFVDELYDRCRELASMPRRFPILPDRQDTGIRRRVHGNYLNGAMDYEKVLFPDE